MKQNDVIVIGGGLTGLFAAITAAKRGRQVLVVTKGVGAIAIGGGTIDMLGYDQAGKPVQNPRDAMAALGQDHPYSILGQQQVEQAMQEFIALCAAEGYLYMGNLQQNQWIPTALGRVKPTCLTPLTMNAANLKTATEVAVVEFEGLKDYCGKVMIDGLAQCPGYQKKYSVVAIRTDINDGRDLTALDVARWLDTKAGQAACFAQLARRVAPNSVILMPPVLGTKPDYSLFRNMEQATQCKIIETVGLPPAVTGYRLRRMLVNCLSKLNVKLIEQANVIRTLVENGRCSGIVTGNLDRERTYRADSFILATGGFFGGGLQAGAGQATEIVFDLPVAAPTDSSAWSNENLFFSGSQPFAKFGVQVDAKLRPIDTTGRLLLENVYIAGKTLAGYDYCSEKSGNGVALATAYQAGCEA
jgi:glycerol-3-phosphate dehydrogenase subunit B